ncbi:hypothetical protein EDD18DRAFT_1334351 [Armillaria luteobubalina]|uniref:Epidermal growth factor receptor-like transmembrane-juxtamembrane segment domain-containing protein n=1 Tax=Armillaria luteobubalina TaxID=153913 RepID=A0AA39PZ52_9AGAR|nr:hypothetical protein EDD18DRAFT_1334351 [Armillaria luteobubalina]
MTSPDSMTFTDLITEPSTLTNIITERLTATDTITAPIQTITSLSIKSAEFTAIRAVTKNRTITVTALSTSSILQTSSYSTASSCNCGHKTAPAVIAGTVIGSLLASVLVFVLLFILWRRKSHNKISNDTSGDNDPAMTYIPNTILTPISPSSTRSGSIISITSESGAISRRLSQSSRTAYEEEIEQLRHRIRYMEEEIELTYSGSVPPSYRSSRRSDVSDTQFGRSSSPPPPLPSREISQ